MKFEKTETYGWSGALRGMRNPMNSWDRSDTKVGDVVAIGPNDLKLAQNLVRSGNEHRKFLRQIFVSVDITAPIYWWKEMDQYKIGTTTNSCSTMHKIASTPITIDCFETDDFSQQACDVSGYEIDRVIHMLESLRQDYLETKDKKYWKELIRWLPESWLQKRTITMSYENILSMYRQRKGHKLTEWSVSFKNWAESLPYAKELFIEPFEKN